MNTDKVRVAFETNFGSCTINLVADNLYEKFIENTIQDYTEEYSSRYLRC
jgi:hypothetical protein